MGFVSVSTESIVEKLAKDVKFLQPVYESITNSLEAHAENIEIEFFTDYNSCFEGVIPKIIGFRIIDDGEGFIDKNRKAFCELWTKNKVQLGCKGSGRFTWLSVYKDIHIQSEIVSEQQIIDIPFSLDFKAEDIKLMPYKVTENKTIMEFSNVTEKFYDAYQKIDRRFVANLSEIKDAVVEYLIIKLFLLKRQSTAFNIILKIGAEQEVINFDSIPDLSSKTFNIFSDITNETYNFTLYYRFINDNENSKKVFYCANARATKSMDDDALGFSCGLPNNNSFMMLLCSDYFDDKDNDSRDDLSLLSNRKNQSLDVPLLYSDINPYMKKAMHEAILEAYPEIPEINSREEEKAIQTAPYLTSFIRRDKDILKSEKSLLIKANERFAKAKINAKETFDRLLKEKNIDDDTFNKAVDQISMVAAAELGEYILFRENLIMALDKSLSDPTKYESFIHNIFMPMQTSSFAADENKHLLSNLWLLDDKFMTYSYAASDEAVASIKNDIAIKNEEKFKDKNRPDISIFFNKQDGHKNLVMIEFKRPNADKNEKKRALTELPDDVAIIKKHIPDIDTIWSYIITTIDDEFRFSIENQPYFMALFDTTSENCAYYSYFVKQNAHEFIIDLKTITSDALARNKTFMDILKKQ